MITVKVTNEMGRGLYATRIIKAGEVVSQCEILVLSEIDTAIVAETDLKYYTFKFNELQDCLVLGLGEIFNHADQPNVSFELVDFEGRKVMQFKALSNIETDAQLFIDYNSDTQVETEDYINTKSLVG